ncbi:MAG: flagellar motor switch protein FliG [bacterium]
MAIKATGPQKAAMLLMALGSDIAGPVFKHLDEKEIDQLTLEIAKLPKIEPVQKKEIIAEFRELLLAQEFILKGGIDYAREVLKRAMGEEGANRTIDKAVNILKIKPFDFMKKADPSILASFLSNEHPQTIAFVISNLPAVKASDVLLNLAEDIRKDVSRRVASMKSVSRDFVSSIEDTLKEKYEKEIGAAQTQIIQKDGVDSVVKILQESDRETEKAIIDAISEEDPELAEEVRKRMFIFDDLTKLDDRTVQRVLREVDSKDLALALKGASDTIKNLIFRNMPKRAQEMLKEEISYLGPKKLSEVEEVQQKIIGVIRQLEESSEIMISRGGKGKEAIIE